MKLAAVLIHYGDPEFTRSRLSTLESSVAVSEIVTILHDWNLVKVNREV